MDEPDLVKFQLSFPQPLLGGILVTPKFRVYKFCVATEFLPYGDWKSKKNPEESPRRKTKNPERFLDAQSNQPEDQGKQFLKILEQQRPAVSSFTFLGVIFENEFLME